MTTLYKTQATALAGRNGQVKTNDGLLDLELAYPKEMGGHRRSNEPRTTVCSGLLGLFL